jgi:NosR/NirI family nitrous oxide reductase transcriptional regulator
VPSGNNKQYSVYRLLSIFLVFANVMLPSPGTAAEDDSLEQFLSELKPAEVFAGADAIDSPQGRPPISTARKGGKQIGYVFLNTDFVKNVGYSGKPIHLLIGIGMDGVITGVKLVEHHEPIVLVGIPEQKIVSVLDNYLGLNVVDYVRQQQTKRQMDIVSGATVTIMVIDDSILNSATKVARHLGIGGLAPDADIDTGGVSASIDMTIDQTEDWFTLVQEESVTRLLITVDGVNRAFEEVGDPVAIERREEGDPNEIFLELYTALASVPGIGRSLLGDAEYRNLKNRLAEGQHAILLMGRGRYSFKGSGYVRGGIFDRFQLTQRDRSIRFSDVDHKRLRRANPEAAPDFKEVGVFVIPANQEFNPTDPWRIELLVSRNTGPTSKAFTTFDLRYQVPDRYVVKEATPTPAAKPPKRNVFDFEGGKLPLWTKLWLQKKLLIGVLLAALAVLTFVFFFQNWLVKRQRLTDYVRIGFLCFTLFGLGWYANAQLSVVNILTVFNALVSGFDWEYFLMEPLIFILWGSVAASLLFWGRGAYCGWLCPFGALQELLNRVAKAIKVPQTKVPWWLHERLWAVKYIIFLALFGISLHSLGWAERFAEVEPFKTAIILKFERSWPYVVFALSTLVAGLTIERFYCRYVCPLGAALAIPGKLRMFEWLKRYKECGAPCQRCGNECMVQAIHKEGNINPNECLYCLHCQTVYFDQHVCRYLVQRRLRHERRRASGRERKRPLAAMIEQIETAKN